MSKDRQSLNLHIQETVHQHRATVFEIGESLKAGHGRRQRIKNIIETGGERTGADGSGGKDEL
jgi:hypothetical protein